MTENTSIDITHYQMPGIFRIVCVENQKAFFQKAENVWVDLQDFVQYLKEGHCENQELLQDFLYYGMDGFKFRFVRYGPKYLDEKVLDQELETCKKEWPSELY